jgi:hypothetical protein
MTAYGRRLQRPFALSAYGRSPRPNGLQAQPPPPPLLRRTVYLGGRTPCGQSVDFALKGDRVDSPWTAAQSCEGPSGTGLRLPTVCPHSAGVGSADH